MRRSALASGNGVLDGRAVADSSAAAEVEKRFALVPRLKHGVQRYVHDGYEGFLVMQVPMLLHSVFGSFLAHYGLCRKLEWPNLASCSSTAPASGACVRVSLCMHGMLMVAGSQREAWRAAHRAAHMHHSAVAQHARHRLYHEVLPFDDIASIHKSVEVPRLAAAAG